MATRRTHSYTKRINHLSAKKKIQPLTQEEIAELAELMARALNNENE